MFLVGALLSVNPERNTRDSTRLELGICRALCVSWITPDRVRTWKQAPPGSGKGSRERDPVEWDLVSPVGALRRLLE